MNDAVQTTISPLAPDAHAQLQYSFKPSMMGAPHVFRLAPDVLQWEVAGRQGEIPYAAVRRIRLSFRPVSLAAYRFTTEIWSDRAPKLTLASTSWRSLVEQQRQDADYALFVRALSRRIGQAGGAAVFQTGSPPLLYWPGAAVCLVLAFALPWILFRAVQDDALGAAALVAALIVLFGWQLGNIFWRNRPGTFAPDAVPLTVLPRG